MLIRFTTRSHWPDGHWCVPLAPFASESGILPQDGQYVPQEAIDRLAAFEDIGIDPEYLAGIVDYWRKTTSSFESVLRAMRGEFQEDGIEVE